MRRDYFLLSLQLWTLSDGCAPVVTWSKVSHIKLSSRWLFCSPLHKKMKFLIIKWAQEWQQVEMSKDLWHILNVFAHCWTFLWNGVSFPRVFLKNQWNVKLKVFLTFFIRELFKAHLNIQQELSDWREAF